MENHLEIEFKNVLTKDEFIRLQQFLGVTENDFFLQVNDYFDTDDFALKKAGCALRIRTKEGHMELTLKEPNDAGLLETNEPISEVERDLLLEHKFFPKGAIEKKLKSMQISLEKISHFGTLTTSRAEIPFYEGLLVLDKSFYLNKEDFEVEYEVTDPKAYKHITRLLTSLNIPVRKTENKVQRFYNVWRKKRSV